MKPIKDFEGYVITEDGRVLTCKTGGTGRSDVYKEMSWFYSNSGYKTVKLSKNNKSYHFPIHILVAKHYVDGWFEGAIVDHRDRNKENNHKDNLRWATQSENLAHIDPVKNFVNCKVYCKGVLWNEFNTLKEMRKCVEETFGVSGLSFQKYGYNKRMGLTLERCRDYPKGE